MKMSRFVGLSLNITHVIPCYTTLNISLPSPAAEAQLRSSGAWTRSNSDFLSPSRKERQELSINYFPAYVVKLSFDFFRHFTLRIEDGFVIGHRVDPPGVPMSFPIDKFSERSIFDLPQMSLDREAAQEQATHATFRTAAFGSYAIDIGPVT